MRTKNLKIIKWENIKSNVENTHTSRSPIIFLGFPE